MVTMPAFAQKGPQKPLRQTRRNASSVPTSSVGSNCTTVRKTREGFESTLQHLKRGRARQAGIVEMEAPLHVSNVMLWCANHNGPARVGFREGADGAKERYCKQCDATIAAPHRTERKRA